MRVAIFYGGYLPGKKYGGPVTSLYNFTELLGNDMELYIVCSNHDLKEKTPYRNICDGWNEIGKCHVRYLYDSEISKKFFNKIIHEIEPDLLYASSIFSAKIIYPLLNISKKTKIPLLLAPRGELNNNALARKALKKKIYLSWLKSRSKLKDVFYQATSIDEKKNIINKLGVNPEQVYFLPNVPGTPVSKTHLKKVPGNLNICFVGRIVENKNLCFAIEVIENVNCNIKFDIYGPKEDMEYWNRCKKRIDNCPPNISIHYKGVIDPLEMGKLYAHYDCFILPTLFENYGQAIVEAMLHDNPVIISKGTTPWDDINEYNAGYAISLKDKIKFTEAIENIGAMNDLEYGRLIQRLQEYCSLKFDFAKLKEQYIYVFDHLKNSTISRK